MREEESAYEAWCSQKVKKISVERETDERIVIFSTL